MCSNGWRWWVMVALAWTGLAGAADGFFRSARQAVVCRDATAEGGRCLVADMTQARGTVFSFETGSLAPGRYRLTVPLKLSEINSLNSAPLEWKLAIDGAGAGGRAFDILTIERAGIYQQLDCEFAVVQAGVAKVTLTWERASMDAKGTGVRVRVKSGEVPTLGEGAAAAAPDALDDIELEDEPDLATLKYLYLAVAAPVLDKLSEMGIVRLEVDKIRYRPGESAAIDLALRNYSAQSRRVTVTTSLVRELNERLPVDERVVELAGGAESTMSLQSPPLTAKWGYAVETTVRDGEAVLAQRAEYFTVHDNMWAVVMAGRGASQFTAHVTEQNARDSALNNQRRYRNWVESGFWAPDEFGDFTPDTEFWWGGQGCYYGSVTGTQLMIAEGHRRGISFAVYSNIWGGDGPPAFEMVRRHPDWGYPAEFNTEWFERWDRNTMGTGKPGPGMHVWPYTVMNGDNPEPFRHHGRELIATHRMFGWDAVRYDSHGIDDGTARMVELGRELVWAELPDFQYGYNSSVPHGLADKLNAFKSQCRNGGLIMEEGIRGYGENQQTYAAFARRLLDYRAEARLHGGYFIAIGMDKCYKNDLLYQYLFWFAGNTHMCYDWLDVSVADYAQFATRYAGLLWDPLVTTVPAADKWVDAGAAGKSLWWLPEYVHQRDLGEGRRQLIVHLINHPLEEKLYTNTDCKLPAPLERIPLSIRLPAGALVERAWLLTAEYALSQQELAVKPAGPDRIELVVPRLRFWSTVAIELEQCAAFE